MGKRNEDDMNKNDSVLTNSASYLRLVLVSRPVFKDFGLVSGSVVIHIIDDTQSDTLSTYLKVD